jgi:hypothetical protein
MDLVSGDFQRSRAGGEVESDIGSSSGTFDLAELRRDGLPVSDQPEMSPIADVGNDRGHGVAESPETGRLDETEGTYPSGQPRHQAKSDGSRERGQAGSEGISTAEWWAHFAMTPRGLEQGGRSDRLTEHCQSSTTRLESLYTFPEAL